MIITSVEKLVLKNSEICPKHTFKSTSNLFCCGAILLYYLQTMINFTTSQPKGSIQEQLRTLVKNLGGTIFMQYLPWLKENGTDIGICVASICTGIENISHPLIFRLKENDDVKIQRLDMVQTNYPYIIFAYRLNNKGEIELVKSNSLGGIVSRLSNSIIGTNYTSNDYEDYIY